MNSIEYFKNSSLEIKYKLLAQAYIKICKTLREHPVDMDWYIEDEQRIAILLGGNERDPEGVEWSMYFVKQVIKEVMSNEKND